MGDDRGGVGDGSEGGDNNGSGGHGGVGVEVVIVMGGDDSDYDGWRHCWLVE